MCGHISKASEMAKKILQWAVKGTKIEVCSERIGIQHKELERTGEDWSLVTVMAVENKVW